MGTVPYSLFELPVNAKGFHLMPLGFLIIHNIANSSREIQTAMEKV